MIIILNFIIICLSSFITSPIEKYVSNKERFLEDVGFVKSVVKKLDMGEC